MSPTQCVSSVHELRSWYMADHEGDVPKGTGQPDIPGAGLKEGIPALTCLKDANSSLVVAEQVHKRTGDHSLMATVAFNALR